MQSHTRSPHASSSSDSGIEPELAADLWLDPEIGVPAGATKGTSSLSLVLLTGATGFLGAYLLRDLLTHTRARVVCLVRATSPAEARSRILFNLDRFKIELAPGALERIEGYPGDLAEPRLGLSLSDYEQLATHIDTIIHGAAVMNFYHSYRKLRMANVEGTRRILRFAVDGRIKAVHHISSTGVYDSDVARGKVVKEDDIPAHCHGSVMGYTQTKWVSEQLMFLGRERGLPVSIYRPPFIMGDSISGIVDLDNLIVRMLVGSVQGGCFPDEPSTIGMIPVDSLSRAIVHLAGDPTNAGRTFHPASANPISAARFGQAARAFGYALTMPSYHEWVRRLPEFARRRHNALRPLVRFYTTIPRNLKVPSPEVFRKQPQPVIDSERTNAALSHAGLVPPPISAALLERYIRYFVSAGWIPHPDAMPAARKTDGSRPPYVLSGSPA